MGSWLIWLKKNWGVRNRNGRFQKKRSVVEIAWAKNGTSHTLTGTGDVIEITDLTAKKFHFVLCHLLQSGAINPNPKLDADGGSVYARRASQDGTSDATSVNDTKLSNFNITAYDFFAVSYFANISGEEALMLQFVIRSNTAGAGNVPIRLEYASKDSGTTQFTGIDFDNAGTGDYASGSNLSALGTD